MAKQGQVADPHSVGVGLPAIGSLGRNLSEAEPALPGLRNLGTPGHIGMGERVLLELFLAGLAQSQFCPD